MSWILVPERQLTSPDDWLCQQTSASAPCRKYSPILTHHFFLLVLHSLGLGGPGSLLIGTSGFSLTLRTVTLFCNCKQLREAGLFLFIPVVSSFHPPPFPEFSLALMVGVDTDLFCSTDGVWGFSMCWVLGNIISISLWSSLMLTSSHNSCTWHHNSSMTAQVLQARAALLQAWDMSQALPPACNL